MTNYASLIGRSKLELSTPALCLDLDKFEKNIIEMVSVCRQHEVDWRPHAKCHKSPMIARRLVEAGAIGVTCATIAEAEVMVENGIDDVLIANMIAGQAKLERLVEVAKRSSVIICVDQIEQARAISLAMSAAQTSVRVLIELEIGLNRVGIGPGEPGLALAAEVSSLPGVELEGVMAYEGHLLTVENASEKEHKIREAIAIAVRQLEAIRAAGHTCSMVSCGGTGSYPITVGQPGVTEIQAGGAIFMDCFYEEACKIQSLSHALTLLSTVVSRPCPERAVIDVGRKSLDLAIHPPRILNRSGVSLEWLSAEHGILSVDNDAAPMVVGDQVEIIPGYADLTNHLHTCFLGFRGNFVEEVFSIVR